MFKAIKDKIHKWMNSMADENQEQFGDKKLDCCGLNKEKKEE